MTVCNVLVLLLFIFLQNSLFSHAGDSSVSPSYRWFCDLTLSPVVTLEWNSSIRGYVVQKEDDEPYDGTKGPYSGWTRRLFGKNNKAEPASNLRSTAPDYYSSADAALLADRNLRLIRSETVQPKSSPLFVGAQESTSHEPVTPAATVEARACDCWNPVVWGGTFYCVMPRTHCAIPSSPIGLPGCVDVQKDRRIVRSIWPVLVVWYSSVLFCLSFTITGRHAMSCCFATICPGWNRRTADRLLRNDPNQANQMLLRHYRIMRASYERRLIRRLRRRARRDRRRARQRRRNEENGIPNPPQEEESYLSDLEDDMPFPNLWDLAIIPRPTATASGEPQPTTLTLKTRIYKQISHEVDNDDNDDLEIFQDETSGRDNTKELMSEVKELLNGDDNDSGIGDNNENSGELNSGPVPSSASVVATTEFTAAAEDGQSQHGDQEEGSTKPENPSDADDNQHRDDNQTATIVSQAEAPGESKVTNAALKHDTNDFSDWDEHACAICYAELEDGDRVGALPCGHNFHVDPCLKHWLARRNVCPLCLTENIATPNFVTPPPESGGEHRQPTFIVAAPGGDHSMSDQDRSSSRDEHEDDNSSGILDSLRRERDPYMVPAFGQSNASRSRMPRMIELTSLFSRQTRQPRSEEEEANRRRSEAIIAEHFSNENGGQEEQRGT